MTNRQSASDGTLSDMERRWLVRRAQGGYGLLSTCAASVCHEGRAWQGQLGITEANMPGLTALAAELIAHGAAPFVQLHHGGREAKFAPGLRLSTVDGEGVRGATPADLERVVDAFVVAARRCEAAGFSGVEIHGANGYLFTQFLAPRDNPRTDAWGGDLAGRAKLLRDTTRAVRAATSSRFAVGVRISPVDIGSRRGLVLDDAQVLARWLADDGIDFLHLSLTDASGAPPLEDTDEPVATVIRRALPASVALVAAGGIQTAADVGRAMAAGVDIVATGRVAIPHPDWPTEVTQPGWSPLPPPWTRQHLASVDVGEKLFEYLQLFRGLVEGGRPA